MFFVFFSWSKRWVQSPLWGRWAEDKPRRKLPRGHFLFSLLQKKRKKALQVRAGLPVESTDGSAHIRRLGTEPRPPARPPARSLSFPWILELTCLSHRQLRKTARAFFFFFGFSLLLWVFGLKLLPLEIICPPPPKRSNLDRWQRSVDTPHALPNTSACPSKHTCAAGRAVH